MRNLARFLLIGIPTVFLIVGLVGFAFLAFNIHAGMKGPRNAERGEGVVLSAPDKGKPTIEFQTRDGQRIRIDQAEGPAFGRYNPGQNIDINYNPHAPEQARIDQLLERWQGWLMIGAFAGVFTAFGSAAVIAVVRRMRLIYRLVRQGVRRDGIIVDFQVEERIVARRKGGQKMRSDWYVVVAWTDHTGTQWRERADKISYNPATKFTIGDTVTVLIDPDDARKFWIDLFNGSKTRDLSITPELVVRR